MAMLLTVLSTAALGAGFDSVTTATYCRVAVIDDSSYKLIFQAPQKDDVNIQLIDQQEQVVFSEDLKNVDVIEKSYDMSQLPTGSYTFMLRSNGYLYQEEIVSGDLSGFYFHFSQIDDRKIALVGEQPTKKKSTLYVLDQDKEVVYREVLTEGKVIKKFNFEKLLGNEATFMIYYNNQLIEEKVILL